MSEPKLTLLTPYATLRRQIAARYFYLPTPCQIGDSGLERNLWPRIGRINPPKIQSNRGARAAPRRATIVTTLPRSKLRGLGLRFAVPRLQSCNDETPPKSGASREDHHADTTQFWHDAGRRRSARHKRAAGAAAARKQAHDRLAFRVSPQRFRHSDSYLYSGAAFS